MKLLKFNGVVRLSIDGKVYEAANGTLSLDNDDLITTDTQFAVGSVSKQFTAAAVMLLREHTVLSKDIIKEMTTDYSPDCELHYGYGFCVGSNNTFWHEGEIDSYLTHEFTSPNEKYNLFISTNRYKYQKLSELAAFIKAGTR